MSENKSKRIKISLGYTNKGKYTFIPEKDVIEANQRIRAFMKPLVKEYITKEAVAKANASRVVLNC